MTEIIYSSQPELYQIIKLDKMKELGKFPKQLSLKIKLFLGISKKLLLIKSSDSDRIHCKIIHSKVSLIKADLSFENIILKLKNIWHLRQNFIVNFSVFDDFYVGNLLINDTLKGILIIKNEDLEFHGIQETMRIKFEEEEMKKFKLEIDKETIVNSLVLEVINRI
jgi:hypothetical protein